MSSLRSVKSPVSWFIPVHVAWWVSFGRTTKPRNLNAKPIVASTSTPPFKAERFADEQEIASIEVEELLTKSPTEVSIENEKLTSCSVIKEFCPCASSDNMLDHCDNCETPPKQR